MNDPKSVLRRGWVSAGHTELWNCQGTYCTVPYKLLPRVDGATDDLGLLDDVSPELAEAIAGTSTLDSGDNEVSHLEGLVANGKALGLNLPEPFLHFMRNASLQAKVPTCTACFLALSQDYTHFRIGGSFSPSLSERLPELRHVVSLPGPRRRGQCCCFPLLFRA